MPQPGQEIRVPEVARERLARAIADLLQQAESDHAPYLNKLDVWWEWYDAKPLAQRRTEPWPGASNIVVPLIQTFADAMTARMWGAMHTPRRTWMIDSPNDANRPLAKSLDEFLNLESRSTFDALVPTHDWAFENCVVGSSVLGVFWRKRVGYRWTGNRKAQPVTITRGPELVHIPRESILWERDRTIQESSFVARQMLYTWPDMLALAEEYKWDKEALAACQGHEGVEGVSGKVMDRKRERVDQSPGTSAWHEPHSVWEVWLEPSLASLFSKASDGGDEPLYRKGDPQIPIVVTFHRSAQKILKVQAHPYYFWRWPFLDIYFQKLPGQGASKGLSKMLEHQQRAITTVVNQAIDARTLRNSIPFFTNSPALRNFRITPGVPIYVEEELERSILPFQFTTEPSADIALMNFVTSTSERVTGIADVNLGRETRLGGHPAPATNTLVQLQEGAKVLSTKLQLVRQQLGTAAEWMISMYQQFDMGPQGRLAAKLGVEDAARLAELAVSPESFIFDAHALSESVNPEGERNAAIAISQVTSNYYGFALRMLSLTQQVPGVAKVAMRAIEAMTESYKRILEASDVDEIDRFILQIKQAGAQDAQSLTQFEDFVRGQLGTGGAQPGEGAAGGGEGGIQFPGMGPGNGSAGPALPVAPGAGDDGSY